MEWARDRGVTVFEVALAVGLAALVAVVGVPVLSQVTSDVRTLSAARYLATRVQSARLEAARRGVQVALRFEPHPDGLRFRIYVDGNGDGVRHADIARGIDWPLGPSDALRDHFGDADLRVALPAPGIDGGAAVPLGSDPVRFGANALLSWSPLGSSTSGTAYVAGPRGPQLAVRVFGVTGRVRVLRFDPGAGRWLAH